MTGINWFALAQSAGDGLQAASAEKTKKNNLLFQEAAIDSDLGLLNVKREEINLHDLIARRNARLEARLGIGKFKSGGRFADIRGESSRHEIGVKDILEKLKLGNIGQDTEFKTIANKIQANKFRLQRDQLAGQRRSISPILAGINGFFGSASKKDIVTSSSLPGTNDPQFPPVNLPEGSPDFTVDLPKNKK